MQWEVQAGKTVVNGKPVGNTFNAAIDTGFVLKYRKTSSPTERPTYRTTLIYAPVAVGKAICESSK